MITSLSLVNVLPFIISLSFVAAMQPPVVLEMHGLAPEVPTGNGRLYEKYCQLTPLAEAIPKSHQFGAMEEGDSVVIPNLLYGAIVDDARLKGNNVGAEWLDDRAARKGKSMKDEWTYFLWLFNGATDMETYNTRGSFNHRFKITHGMDMPMELDAFFQMVYGETILTPNVGPPPKPEPRGRQWGPTVVRPKAGAQDHAEMFFRRYQVVQGPAVPTQNAALYHKYRMLQPLARGIPSSHRMGGMGCSVHIPQLLYGGMLDDAFSKGNSIGREWLETRAAARGMSMKDEWIEFLSFFNGESTFDAWGARGSFNHDFKTRYGRDIPQELDDFFKMVYGETILAFLSPDEQF